MSEFSVQTGLPKEKLHGLQKQQKQQDHAKEQQLTKQDPSQTTGIQWAFSQVASASANTNQVAPQQKADSNNVDSRTSSRAQIVTPEMEDTAILSSSISMKDTAVKAPDFMGLRNYMRLAFNVGALEGAYRETYKKSKSHNLLLERFMSHVKLSGLTTLLSLLGVDAEEQTKMQGEVREEALKEIDTKLTQDWAYTKALVEIMG